MASSTSPCNHMINTELPWAEDFFFCIIQDYKLWFKTTVIRRSVAAAKVMVFWDVLTVYVYFAAGIDLFGEGLTALVLAEHDWISQRIIKYGEMSR